MRLASVYGEPGQSACRAEVEPEPVAVVRDDEDRVSPPLLVHREEAEGKLEALASSHCAFCGRDLQASVGLHHAERDGEIAAV